MAPLSIDTNKQNIDEEEKQFEKLISQMAAAYRERKVTKDDFTLIRVIGTGSYGKVLLVKKKDSGGLYAMKVLKKKHIVQKN